MKLRSTDGYIRKHWRGELSLAASFWINCILLNGALGLVLVILNLVSSTEHPRTSAGAILMYIYIQLLLVYPWQAIGLWRCSNRRRKEMGNSLWLRIAKASVIVWVLVILGNLVNNQTYIKELQRITFGITLNSTVEVFRSSDGVSEVTTPIGWKELQADVNPAASIITGNESKELYVQVTSEAKSNLLPALEEAFELGRLRLINQFVLPTISSPERINLNEMDAIKFELKGEIKGLDVFYIYMCVEGKDHFHQVIGWTLSGLKKDNRPILEAVMNTFKEQ